MIISISISFIIGVFGSSIVALVAGALQGRSAKRLHNKIDQKLDFILKAIVRLENPKYSDVQTEAYVSANRQAIIKAILEETILPAGGAQSAIQTYSSNSP